MGTSFDLFDVASHAVNDVVTAPVHVGNRAILRDVMVAAGFVPYDKEWWHFTLSAEPFPETYFDFEIRDDLRPR